MRAIAGLRVRQGWLGALARACGCAGIALVFGAAPADAAGFLAGAGVQETSPPTQGNTLGNAADAQFASAFGTCPGAPVFPDRGRFALQEPFNDQNGNHQWDAHVDATGPPDPSHPPSGPPEPYCETNQNNRWDGIYADNEKGPATGVHDPLETRAVAISDGVHKPVVYASVPQIGIFDFYTDDARARLKTMGYDANLVVSANHNESSPDSIGLYGALNTPLGVGVRSGIDEYFMSFLDDRIARAAAEAIHNLRPATLYANQVEARLPDGASGTRYPLLSGLSQKLSEEFPTEVGLPNDNRIAAVDPKMGVLQARGADDKPIFTVASLGAHNQEMGNSGADLSADWPGALQAAVDAAGGGVGMYLVGDNGSIEDPQTDPTVIPGGSENHSSTATQYIQAKATGERFASIAVAAAKTASKLTPGEVKLVRKQFCVPLENNGFLGLAAAGVFGKRQAYVCDASGNPVSPVPNADIATSGAQFRTFVSYADIGPDLQFIDNPAESFPALMLGSPFGKETESCDRPNPAVPTWHARAAYRFQVGLADDLIGYLVPAWSFASGVPGLFNNDSCFQDMSGHENGKLESESVGPTAGNRVADNLASMLDSEKDPTAHIVQGRFVLPNGSYSHWAAGAIGILVPKAGASALDPTGGTLIGDPHTAGFGRRGVDATGFFMDYDGQPQSGPDVTTRGMMVFDSRGCVSARYYLNVFPTLDGSKKLDSAASQPKIKPVGSCGKSVQPGAGGGPKPGPCRDRIRPHSKIVHRGSRLKKGRLALHGTAFDRDCKGRAAKPARVVVTVGRHLGPGRCKFLLADGKHFGPTRGCDGRPALVLLAKGTSKWSLKLPVHLPVGTYTIRSLAIDRAGNQEPVRHHGANVLGLRVRKHR